MYILNPVTCDYVKLYGKKGIKIADGIEFAKQLSLKGGDYYGLFGWARHNYKSS